MHVLIQQTPLEAALDRARRAESRASDAESLYAAERARHEHDNADWEAKHLRLQVMADSLAGQVAGQQNLIDRLMGRCAIVQQREAGGLGLDAEKVTTGIE